MIKKFAIHIIRFYQIFISIFFIPRCKFSPTCSSFAIAAIEKHGVLFGCYRALCRLLKCHPYNNANHYDPI